VNVSFQAKRAGQAMMSRDVLMVLCAALYLACSDMSRAQDDAIESARKLADAHLESTSDPLLQGFKDAESRIYDHFVAFHYFEDNDLGDGWRGGRGGPIVFVDAEKMSVAGVLRPAHPARRIAAGDMSEQLARNVTAYFRKTVPEFHVANYDFSIDDLGDVSYLYVVRKFLDRGLLGCNCVLVVENKTNQILGSEFRFEEHHQLPPRAGRPFP
jgi:hypothetical protein